MYATSSFASSGAVRHCGMYQQVSIDSQVHGNATPHQLVAMLFDGLFESLAKARGAIRADDPEAKGQAIVRAVRIVDEGLRAALDLRNGGTLARDLHALYAYVTTRLTQANLKNDERALDECAALMTPLREAWDAIRPTADSRRNT